MSAIPVAKYHLRSDYFDEVVRKINQLQAMWGQLVVRVDWPMVVASTVDGLAVWTFDLTQTVVAQ